MIGNLLTKEEIPKKFQALLDIDSQKLVRLGLQNHGRNLLSIIHSCSNCKAKKWRGVNRIRRDIQNEIFTGLCGRCSGLCRRGIKNSNWTGGRYVKPDGYVKIRDSSYCHPQAVNGYVLEHRIVMEKWLGRFLTSVETVHHKNGNRSDNRIENLELRVGNHGVGSRFDDLSVPEIDELIEFLQELRSSKK